jgi:hypothetical protein
MQPMTGTNRSPFVFALRLASTSQPLFLRSGITPELTRAEHKAF